MTDAELTALSMAIGVLKREGIFENAEILKNLRTRLSLASSSTASVRDLVATVVQKEPFEDGSPNPGVRLDWHLRNAEDSLSVGTKLFAASVSESHKPQALTLGMDRSAFHDKAWALWQAKRFDSSLLPKLSVHAIRELWDVIYDSMPGASPDNSQAAVLSAEPRAFTDEQIAALRVAADTLIEKYAAPIRAILSNAEHAISTEECAQDVFEQGHTIGFFDIPKETANTICERISAVTGAGVDWHYFGGRVHMKATTTPAQSIADTARAKPVVPTEFEQHGELDAEGWTPPVFPERQYFMQCCDCGLVHELEFAAVKTEPTEGGFHSDELPWPENRVRFKVRRAPAEATKTNAGYAIAVELWKAANAVGFAEFQSAVERLIASPAIDAAGASEGDVFESLLADITGIDTWYRGSPSYEHDAGWFKDRVVRLLEERIAKEKGE